MHTIGPERVARVRAQVCVGGRGGAESVELARSLAWRALFLCAASVSINAHTQFAKRGPGMKADDRKQRAEKVRAGEASVDNVQLESGPIAVGLDARKSGLQHHAIKGMDQACMHAIHPTAVRSEGT